MKTQHTPVPWTVEVHVDNDFEPGYFAVERDERDVGGFAKDVRPLIAKVTYGATIGEKRANARLIAAAPELLEALEDVELRCTQAKIASTIGKPKPSGINQSEFLRNELERIAKVARAAISKATGNQP